MTGLMVKPQNIKRYEDCLGEIAKTRGAARALVETNVSKKKKNYVAVESDKPCLAMPHDSSLLVRDKQNHIDFMWLIVLLLCINIAISCGYSVLDSMRSLLDSMRSFLDDTSMKEEHL